MKRSPGTSSTWFPVLGIIVQMAALGLCSWAMASARNRGRELPAPPPAPVPPPAAPVPPAP